VQSLERAPLLQSLDTVHVSTIEPGSGHETAGALREPFDSALRRLVGTRSHQPDPYRTAPAD